MLVVPLPMARPGCGTLPTKAEPMDLDIAWRFLVALLIGALVGIDRERKKAAEPGPSFGGVRTYTLLALTGATSAWLAQAAALPWVFPVALAITGAAVVASYLRQNAGAADDAPGLTSEVAAIAVFLLAAMCVTGELALAVALGVATSAVLAFKQPLHGWVRKLPSADVAAAIKLLIASFIVLPLLPDRTIDPWDSVNPYKLWLLVILISAMSLAGYVAMRWLGPLYGSAVTAAAGGLVSSTAVTLSFARRSRDATDAVDAHAVVAGILIAWTVMFVRVAVLVAAIQLPLLRPLALPLAAMLVVTAAFAVWHWRAGTAAAADDRSGDGDVAVANPFSLTQAARFGALFAAVLLIVAVAREQFPGVGVYVVAALAGTTDVDAITLSLAGDADAAGRGVAVTGIVIAMLSNTLVKGGIVGVLGRGPARRGVLVATAAIAAAGAAAVLLA